MDSYVGMTDSLLIRAEKMKKLLGTARKRLEKLSCILRREKGLEKLAEETERGGGVEAAPEAREADTDR